MLRQPHFGAGDRRTLVAVGKSKALCELISSFLSHAVRTHPGPASLDELIPIYR